MPTADLQGRTERMFRAKRLRAFALPGVILAYFVYIFFAFDIAGLAGRARVDNAMTLISDMVTYKTVVERDNRSGALNVAVEGERKGAYPEGQLPGWVDAEDGTVTITLEDGHRVTFEGDDYVRYDIPGWGVFEATVSRAGGVQSNLPEEGLPDWISAAKNRVAITTEAGRLTVTRNRTEVFRYFGGWELFWFTLDSPYSGVGFWSLLTGERVDPDRSNLAGAWHDFWNNSMWNHSAVAWAIWETILMAVLGTFGGAMIALPIAFLAARNFTPLMVVRGTVRRLLDFLRGVDALIWTIVLSRAFGLGPLTGALAILVTDTGTFGKLFSEALENVDDKQIEGVRSTGARPLQRYRFGVIPQVMPVLLSQCLYFLEANTRSATVIGAITGGGIGLLLTQAIITQKDWEEVTYYIVLVVLMVIFMDWVSGLIRRRLIRGEATD